jgi:SPX domain protein involved in polyphosphate accumulation
MVQFGEQLEQQKIEKWKEHYLNYEQLKKFIKAQVPSSGEMGPFEKELGENIERIDLFYSSSLSTFAAQLRLLCSQGLALPLSKGDKKASKDSLQRAFVQLYRDLKLLENFYIVNYTGMALVVLSFCQPIF